MNAQSIIRTAQEEMASYGKDPVVHLEIEASSTMMLIAMLQLCTRHPELPQTQNDFAREMVGNLSKAFKPEHTAIAELIKRGWAQEYDVVVDA